MVLPTGLPTAAPTLSLNYTSVIDASAISGGMTPGGGIVLTLFLVTLFLAVAYWYLVPERDPCVKGGEFYCPQFRPSKVEGGGNGGDRKRPGHDSIPKPLSSKSPPSSPGSSKRESVESAAAGGAGGVKLRISEVEGYVNTETVTKLQHHHDQGGRLSSHEPSAPRRLRGDSAEPVSATHIEMSSTSSGSRKMDSGKFAAAVV